MFELSVIEKDGKQFVNSMDLAIRLGASVNGGNYKKWINRNIVNVFGFEEGYDYGYTCTQTGIKGGRPRTDILLTLEATKHVCLMANTEIGRDIRKEFIKLQDEYTAGKVIEANSNQLQLNEENKSLINTNKNLEKAIEARDKMINQAIVALQTVNPIDSIGTPSKVNGKHRTKLRRACYVSTKDGDPNQLVLGFEFNK